MNRFLRANLRRLNTGIFWMSLLFVLPNCSLDSEGAPFGSGGGSNGGSDGGSDGGSNGEDGGSNLSKGPEPWNDLVYCDIVEWLDPPLDNPSCAGPEAIANGIPLSEAAIALAEGRTSSIGLDYSQDAINECGGPRAIKFLGPFPQGLAVCLNCDGAIGTPYQPTVTVACKNRCLDSFNTYVDSDGNVVYDTTPPQQNIDYCTASSKPSTNTANDTCFLGACNNGAVSDTFVDPRKFTEPVVWFDPEETGAVAGGLAGNDLTRTTATAGAWDAGAVSDQWITRGDAFVEFSATAGGSVMAGFAEVPGGCMEPSACPDTDATDASVKVGIVLLYDGTFYVSEGGALLGPFGTLPAGNRFRVYVREKPNKTASVRYTALVGPCLPGTVCSQTMFHESTVVVTYPLRVDSSLFHQNAKITNATLVRIK